MAALAILVTMGLLAPNYLSAQSATNADDFRRAFTERQGPRYTLAAALDLLFALSYAFLGVTIPVGVHPWRSLVKLAARIGSILVIAGALLDELENVRLLGLIANYRTVSDHDVRTMSSNGPIKLWLTIGGMTLVVLCTVVERSHPTKDNSTSNQPDGSPTSQLS